VRAVLDGAAKLKEEAKTKSIVLSEVQSFDRFYNDPKNAKEKAAFDRAVALRRVRTPY